MPRGSCRKHLGQRNRMLCEKTAPSRTMSSGVHTVWIRPWGLTVSSVADPFCRPAIATDRNRDLYIYNQLRGRAAASSTRAGAWPLKQQSSTHSTARAFVALKASAKPAIDRPVLERSAALVSNRTRFPSEEPCSANVMTTTSSGPAADSVPRMACDTSACVAASSTSSRPAKPSTVSVNSAHNAVASRRASPSSGIVASRCLLIPTKIALIPRRPLASSF